MLGGSTKTFVKIRAPWGPLDWDVISGGMDIVAEMGWLGVDVESLLM